jgi:hypothetical protein
MHFQAFFVRSHSCPCESAKYIATLDSWITQIHTGFGAESDAKLEKTKKFQDLDLDLDLDYLAP